MSEEAVVDTAPAVVDTAAPTPVAAPAASAPAAPKPGKTAPAAPAAAPVADDADKPGYWASDWRERMAGGDEKVLKQLGRYASPEDVWKKARELEGRISSGALKPVLGKDAKPEEVAEYRKALGIPEAPDKYELKDVQIDPAEKPFMDALFKSAHETNQTPEQLAANVRTWHSIKQQALEAQEARDNETAKKTEDALREEWGGEFRRNVNLIHGFLDGAGDQSLKDDILSARLPDGTPIGSSPAAMKLWLGVALKDNPAGVVVSAGGGDPMKGTEARIAEIEKMMREDRKAYNDPKISGPDGEYSKLLEARETLKARS